RPQEEDRQHQHQQVGEGGARPAPARRPALVVVALLDEAGGGGRGRRALRQAPVHRLPSARITTRCSSTITRVRSARNIAAAEAKPTSGSCAPGNMWL